MTKQNPKCSTSSDKTVNPFWGLLLDTDVPTMMFQPMKMMALGQIHSMALINRRFKAYAALPYELMGLRTPSDIMQANFRFLQTAMRDYSEAIENMAEAVSAGVGDETSAPSDQARQRHDYLTLPSDEPSDPLSEAREPLAVCGKDTENKDCAA